MDTKETLIFICLRLWQIKEVLDTKSRDLEISFLNKCYVHSLSNSLLFNEESNILSIVWFPDFFCSWVDIEKRNLGTITVSCLQEYETGNVQISYNVLKVFLNLPNKCK